MNYTMPSQHGPVAWFEVTTAGLHLLGDARP